MRIYGIFIFLIIIGGVADDSSAQKYTTGIELALSLDNPVLKTGAKVTLVTKMTNTLPVSLKVQVGWIPCGSSLETAWAYQVTLVEAEGKKRELPWTSFIGYCSTGSMPLVVELNNSKPKVFRREVWIDKWIDGKTYLYFGSDSGFRVDPPCNLIIRARHSIREANYSRGMLQDAKPDDIQGPYWVGDAESNDVFLRIEKFAEDLPVSEEGAR